MIKIEKIQNHRIYILLLVLGLIIRSISLLTKGMEDVDVMINWGLNISNLGWDKGYLAIYFPSSHLIFNAIVDVSKAFDFEVFNLFTIIRLSSDILFLLLLVYLNILRFLSRPIVLLIWLNPLLMVLTLSGYTDTFSITLLLASLVCLGVYQERNKKYFAIFSGFLFAFFLFLKPQTLLLMGYLFFFIFIFVTFRIYTKKVFDSVFLFVSLLLPSLVMFFLFSVLLSSPTKMSCGENIGPRTISSLENSNQTEWNVCIDRTQIGIPYPYSGPNICIEKQFKAFSPLGSNGFCVTNYKYLLPTTVNDFWETGYIKLKNQVINGSAEHMPSYSANMPNVWHIYVVNFLNYDEAKEVWSYKATEKFNKNVWFSILIFTFVYSLLLFWIYRHKVNNYLALISLIGFPITFIIPFFATLAHENHFALGLLFSYLLLNLNLFNKGFLRLFHTLLLTISLLLALNISRLYLWPMWIESQNPILHIFGKNLLTIMSIPNIYQISLITSLAASVLIICLPLGASSSNNKPVI
jgi:hypothetical protein